MFGVLDLFEAQFERKVQAIDFMCPKIEVIDLCEVQIVFGIRTTDLMEPTLDIWQ